MFKKIKDKKDKEKKEEPADLENPYAKIEPSPERVKDDDRFEKLPKGAPGRKSFKLIPDKKKNFWRPEALALRKCFIIMLPFHALFIVTDIFIYEVHVFAILMDSLLLWLDFFNYMTLNKIFVGVEIGAHFLISVIALSWF